MRLVCECWRGKPMSWWSPSSSSSSSSNSRRSALIFCNLSKASALRTLVSWNDDVVVVPPWLDEVMFPLEWGKPSVGFSSIRGLFQKRKEFTQLVRQPVGGRDRPTLRWRQDRRRRTPAGPKSSTMHKEHSCPEHSVWSGHAKDHTGVKK